MLLLEYGSYPHRGGLPSSFQCAISGATLIMSRVIRMSLMHTFTALGGRLFQRRGVIGPMPAPLNRWTNARDLPAPPRESFRKWWARTDGGRKSSGSPASTSRKGTGQK